MYQFCGGNTNYIRIFHSQPKPFSTMKMRDLSSLFILFREVLAKFLTMLMATLTLVYWNRMIQRRIAWLFGQLQNLYQARSPPDHIIVDVKPQAGTQWPKHLNLALDSNFIHIPIGSTS
jgi:hypothetical protein